MNAVAKLNARPNLPRLRDFVTDFAALISSSRDERTILQQGRPLLEALIAEDDWLSDEFAQPHPLRYQQYLLHCDSRERFSIVSFVWGPGQSTPIHDHRVWGLIGVLRGAERVESFSREGGVLMAEGNAQILESGHVDAVSPRIGDIHRVSNARDDRASVSIHVYGANIGAVPRSIYDEAGNPSRFISGYANSRLPNLWDQSTAT